MDSHNAPRKLVNPFIKHEGYNCFGCSPRNPLGLKLTFAEDGDEIVSFWEPGTHYQGFFNILHGGIQATLMDEIASWTVYIKAKRAGFTSKAEFRYLKNIGISDGPLELRSRLKGMRRNLADIEVSIYNLNHQLCATGFLTFFTFSKETSREKLYYPDEEAFYQD
jgi:acyl-coenzyme A thioesterase PaaI-like protein